MKFSVFIVFVTAIICLGSQNKSSSVVIDSDQVAMVQDTSFNMERAIDSIKAKIAGREDERAGEVFDNLQIMGGFPAGRITAIMQMAFTQSLGVDCTHCHNPDNWASDEKPQKEITREMWRMVSTINTELLANISDLQGPQPVVNCTTCHRGDVKPALNMTR